ncbi:hypothetical protein L3V77_00985 [Vibrio sp. DW001]|uniref:hypothetical protein n=1 Tax=Vibrio sp. DW001 TaxID=2912315 RepID=UPI0023B05317|nr:hypothetical protein [Vibrio sp. DW001]WED28457.1 hypothetical protein L3V77_00985 [Vibrio sp. DW001]
MSLNETIDLIWIAFQRCFIAWIKDCHTESEVIAIDGKTLRDSYDRSKEKGIKECWKKL